MSQAEHFAAPGRPTGEHNTSRLSRSPPSRRAFPHRLVVLVPYVRIIAGVGLIGSRAMPGGDHLVCVSPLRVFHLPLLSSNQEEPTLKKMFYKVYHFPSEPLMRARSLCLLPSVPCDLLFFLHRLFAYISLRISWGLLRHWEEEKWFASSGSSTPGNSRYGRILERVAMKQKERAFSLFLKPPLDSGITDGSIIRCSNGLYSFVPPLFDVCRHTLLHKQYAAPSSSASLTTARNCSGASIIRK